MSFFSEIVVPATDKPKKVGALTNRNYYYVGDYVVGYSWEKSKWLRGVIKGINLNKDPALTEYILNNGESIFGCEIEDLL